MKKTTKH